MSHLAKNLEVLRKNKGRTQQEVASVVELPRSTYTSYEIGLSEPNCNRLIQLSDYFNVPVDVLLRIDLSKKVDSEISRIVEKYLTQQKA
ncbi:helix-turn-helix transcriptional regulator [Oscillatoria amoena NRMC-F 0135]|nr:helix-turn-helix transcriptional regulator [Oscillatoria amoena NRMC-F 0135]